MKGETVLGMGLLATIVFAENRPNIVFLLTDDQQFDSLGCMGNSEIITPNLDRLAERGVVFERCYATTAICQASRATALTGMYEYKTGCNFFTGGVDLDVWKTRSYPVLLRQAGYRTGFAGKWGCGVPPKLGGIGFDEFRPLDGGQGHYRTAKNPTMTDYAVRYPHITRALGAFGSDFIQDSVAQGQPFCLSISFKAPHDPRKDIDPEDQKLYAGQVFSKPPSYGEQGAAKIAPQARMGRQFLWRDDWSEQNYQENLKHYYQLISGVDSAVGMIVHALEEAGVADNTVIIYTGDNGYFTGAHGLGGKVLPYDRGARVPLIIADPRMAEKGTRSHAVVGNIDYAPTMLDLAGLPVPVEMDGTSLVPVVTDASHRVRDYLTLVQTWDVADRDVCKALAVVSEDWKYLYWFYGDENVAPTEELYNLKRDPHEMNNVASNPEAFAALEKMRQAYDQRLTHWSAQAEPEFYQRYSQLFDRSISWQDKEFRATIDEPKRQKKWGKKLEEAYKMATGVAYSHLLSPR